MYEAAGLYEEIAAMYPVDDEKHLCMPLHPYLSIHSLNTPGIFVAGWKTALLNTLFLANAPLSETLPLIKDIRRSMLAAKIVWEECWMYKSVDAKLRMYEDFEADMRREVKVGRMSVDGARRPGWMRLSDLVQFHWY